MITTPPVMLLIFLFKRTKRKPVNVKSKDGDQASKSTCTCPCGRFCYSLFRTRKREIAKKYEEDVKGKLLSSELPEFKSSWYLPNGLVN